MRMLPPVLAAGLVLLAAPAAHAANVLNPSTTLAIGENNAGEKNQIAVTRMGGKYRVTDVGSSGSNVGTGCTAVGGEPRAVDCSADFVDGLIVLLGANNDSFAPGGDP